MKLKYIILSILTLLVFSGCDDSFMQRYPLDSISDQNYWNDESDLKLYVNQFYGIYIDGFDDALTTRIPFGYTGSPIPYGDLNSDNALPENISRVPMINGIYVTPTVAGSGGWDWSNVRALNFFLINYERANIGDDIKNMYAGEVLFFKAMEYFKKVKLFGEVPWYNKPMETNSPELYAPRTPRGELMDSILSIMNKAVEWLPEKGSEADGRINKEMALLLKARVCLYEGTFRKYHTEIGLSGEKFFHEAVSASDALMNSGKFHIWSTGDPQHDYHDLFVQPDYANNPEIILWKKYSSGLLMQGFLRNYTWNQAQNVVGFTKSLVDEYLCTDGRPISTSLRYLGDDSLQSEMKNRDPRLTQTVCYPGQYALDPTQQGAFVARGKGYNGMMPAIRGTGDEYPSPTGYWPIKFWKNDQAEVNAGNTGGTMPCPIFRYAEALLVNAEAHAELGTCTQDILENTINRLRARVNMPHLLLSDLPSDPRMDSEYLQYCSYKPSALLREIRRERRVELAWENFRWDDLVRWKAGKLTTIPDAIRGIKFNQYQYPGIVVGKDVFVDNSGYLIPYANSLPSGRTFAEPKQYYFPIPTEDIVINSKLSQSPGWEQ